MERSRAAAAVVEPPADGGVVEMEESLSFFAAADEAFDAVEDWESAMLEFFVSLREATLGRCMLEFWVGLKTGGT